jgi:hypothetical protein
MLIPVSCWRADEISQRLQSAVNPTGVISFGQYEYNYISIGEDPGFEGIVDYVNERNIPFYIITGGCQETGNLHDETNPRYRNVQPVIYWETFWMSKAYVELQGKPQSLNIDDLEVGLGYTDFKYRFISFNHKTHYHRCCLLDNMYKHDLFKDGQVSFHWYDINDENTASRTNHYRFKYWIPKMLTIDQENPLEQFNGQSLIPIEYTQSFMQIVSESCAIHYMITEKTATALFCNKPFLVSGPKGFHKMLDRMGFVRYDEIFDYSFDEVDDLEQRIDMLLQNVIKLRSYSFEELSKIHQDLKPKLAFNKRRIHDLAFNIKYVPEFVVNLVKTDDSSLLGDPYVKQQISFMS